MATLAKLNLEPRPDGGPDVEHRVCVPAAWLERGVDLECELPRRLACAVCNGGGCDTCSRSGAFVLYEKGEAPPLIHVRLNAGEPEPRAIRLPAAGVKSDLGVRGCLILHVTPGAPGDGVRQLTAEARYRIAPVLLWAALLASAVVIALIAWLT